MYKYTSYALARTAGDVYTMFSGGVSAILRFEASGEITTKRAIDMIREDLAQADARVQELRNDMVSTMDTKLE